MTDTLFSVLGLRYQVAQTLVLCRGAVVTCLGYIVVLVALRLLVRRSWIAFVLATLVFLSVAMPTR